MDRKWQQGEERAHRFSFNPIFTSLFPALLMSLLFWIFFFPHTLQSLAFIPKFNNTFTMSSPHLHPCKVYFLSGSCELCMLAYLCSLVRLILNSNNTQQNLMMMISRLRKLVFDHSHSNYLCIN